MDLGYCRPVTFQAQGMFTVTFEEVLEQEIGNKAPDNENQKILEVKKRRFLSACLHKKISVRRSYLN